MASEIVVIIISGTVTIITNIVTWLLTKRKYNAEVNSDIIHNMQESLEFYKQLSDDNKERLTECLEYNQKLEKEISDLRSQVFTLMSQICLNLSCTHRVIQIKEDESIKTNSN